MSIATRTGDDGTAGLMFNRRVPKNHPRLEAYGTVDELNAALGFARSHLESNELNERIRTIQLQLVTAMGELAVLPDDIQRYIEKGHRLVEESDIQPLDSMVEWLENKEGLRFDGWATPGDNPASAAFEMARTICRRAERRIAALHGTDPVNPHIRTFFNRLSDVLWLVARRLES